MSAQRPPAVGIDVVDLSDPRCRGKASDGRFIGRVFAPEEAVAIAEAEAPDRRLWAMWAAKEAAFKVVSKMDGGPPAFTHASFHAAADGRVRWQGLDVPLLREERGDVILAVAWEQDRAGHEPLWEAVEARAMDPDPALDLDSLIREHLTEAERGPVHSRPSALVRIGARRALARVLGVAEARVEIVCPGGPAGRTPPLARLDGGPAPADVSLSHHGGWLAWAVRPARRPGGGS